MPAAFRQTGRLTQWIKPEPLIAVVLWGGIYPGAKLGLHEIPVLSFASLRLILAAGILLAVSGWRRPLGVRRPAFGAIANAALAQTVFQLLLTFGLDRTTAGNSAILLATAPLITAMWLALMGREPLTRQQVGGLLVGIIGVVLVVQHHDLQISAASLSGDAIALAAAGAWAWYGVAIGPVVHHLGARRATGLTMVAAAAILTPAAVPQLSRLPWQDISWRAWAGLIYGATLGMVIAMALWGRSVSRLGPKETMIYIYLEPVSAVIFAKLLLGEPFGFLQAFGTMLTFVALWAGRPGMVPERMVPRYVSRGRVT